MDSSAPGMNGIWGPHCGEQPSSHGCAEVFCIRCDVLLPACGSLEPPPGAAIAAREAWRLAARFVTPSSHLLLDRVEPVCYTVVRDAWSLFRDCRKLPVGAQNRYTHNL